MTCYKQIPWYLTYVHPLAVRAEIPEGSCQHGIDSAVCTQHILKVAPAGASINLHLASVLLQLCDLVISHEEHQGRGKGVREALPASEGGVDGVGGTGWALTPLPARQTNMLG